MMGALAEPRKSEIILPVDSVQKRRRVALWKPLSYLDAVRRGRVTVLSADYMMIPGPRMGRIARDMEAALHAPAAPAPAGY